ncbi:MAG: hypothetical protein KA354_23015 [Phycisphaerae bacterium]|nr:hypothetical protein [Phycisphaerae bacterium]
MTTPETPIPLKLETTLHVPPAFFDRLAREIRETITKTLREQRVEAPPPPVASVSPNPAPAAVEVSPEERQKAASLLNRPAIDWGIPPGQYLLDMREVARLLNLSQRTVWLLANCGAMPRPVQIRRLKRWSIREIVAWVDTGCPPDETWQRIRGKALSIDVDAPTSRRR